MDDTLNGLRMWVPIQGNLPHADAYGHWVGLRDSLEAALAEIEARHQQRIDLARLLVKRRKAQQPNLYHKVYLPDGTLHKYNVEKNLGIIKRTPDGFTKRTPKWTTQDVRPPTRVGARAHACACALENVHGHVHR